MRALVMWLTEPRLWEAWRRWIPIAVVLVILVVAPVLAYAQIADSVAVRWTAPGDDGNIGTATRYDLRMSVQPIDATNFDLASVVAGLPAPAIAGTSQHVTVRGLLTGTTYYFAIRTIDDAGNKSAISNVARRDWAVDAAPPSAPSGVKARRGAKSVHLEWSPNSEPDLAGYRVYRSTTSGGPFTIVSPALVTDMRFDDKEPPADATDIYYRVSAVSASGTEGAQSEAVDASMTSAATAAQVQVQGGYPNPSRLSSLVHIPIVVAAGGVQGAHVEILDSGNHRVRRIDLGDLAAGSQEVVWDGRNDAGRVCAPGVYRGWFVTGRDRQAIRIARVP